MLKKKKKNIDHTYCNVISGDLQFPAMRRLSIATAHAFLLVYATTSLPSFECIKRCFEEVREQRPDFQVSNKNNINLFKQNEKTNNFDLINEKEKINKFNLKCVFIFLFLYTILL